MIKDKEKKERNQRLSKNRMTEQWEKLNKYRDVSKIFMIFICILYIIIVIIYNVGKLKSKQLLQYISKAIIRRCYCNQVAQKISRSVINKSIEKNDLRKKEGEIDYFFYKMKVLKS